MKKLKSLFLFAFILLVAYNIFLFAFPLKKTVFYTNEERTEEYIYGKTNYAAILVGSSLSGAFEEAKIFEEDYFNLYLPFTGASTGLDIIKRSDKIPKRLFIEINYMNRGIDSNLINSIFSSPLYKLKYFLPFLLSKNKIFTNLMDRVKSPNNNKTNESRPADHLYNELITKARSEWNQTPDTNLLRIKMDISRQAVSQIAGKKCEIFFYEMPMDSSITNSPLIVFQRNYYMGLCEKEGYNFIGLDKSRNYETGDGLHLLRNDANIYINYFRKEIIKYQAQDLR